MNEAKIPCKQPGNCEIKITNTRTLPELSCLHSSFYFYRVYCRSCFIFVGSANLGANSAHCSRRHSQSSLLIIGAVQIRCTNRKLLWHLSPSLTPAPFTPAQLLEYLTEGDSNCNCQSVLSLFMIFRR